MAGVSDTAAMRAEMRALVADAHITRGRDARSLPCTAHACSVGEIVDRALAASGDLAGDPAYALDLYLAAVGHDLYAGTAVGRARVRRQFGARVDLMIWRMTDRSGRDGEVDLGVRLIKLADLVDNVTGCADGVRDLGVLWARDTFLPLALWMFRLVATAEHARFTMTAALLLGWLDLALDRLREYLVIARAVEARDPAALAAVDIGGRSDRDGARGATAAAPALSREREWREGALFTGGHLFLPSGTGRGASGR